MTENSDYTQDEIERPRAVLTPDDRKFLTGQKEFEGGHPEQQERNARYRIRERVGDAIQDFSFLHDRLPDEDLDTIFEKILEEDRETLVKAVAFILRGVDDVAEVEDFLDDVLSEAASSKYPDQLVTAELSFEVKTKDRDPEAARKRLLTNKGTFRDLEFLITVDETGPLITKLADRNDPIRITEHYDSDAKGEEYTLNDLIKSR